jgi:hypothetical protein
MAIDKSKIINILDPQKQHIKETTLESTRNDAQDITERMAEAAGIPGLGRMTLKEVAAVSTSQFPSLLRDGLKPILFSSYDGVPQTWPMWAEVVQSDKQFEDYLEASRIGLLPIVAEGDPYTQIDLALDRTLQIRNDKRGSILPITREMVLFDKVQMINQMVQDLGEALAMTKEQAAYNVLTTSTNYVRNSTTSDNNEGANTLSTTFSPAGLAVAMRTLKTMKDRKSGRYLGIVPDMLVIGPDLEFAAKQLLFSDSVWRVGGNTTNDVYGTGSDNPFRGAIKEIVITPWMVEGNWVLMRAKRAVTCQQVWGPELFSLTNIPESYNFMHYDVYEYRVDEMFGFGMKNDRFAFLSTATAAPIVD